MHWLDGHTALGNDLLKAVDPPSSESVILAMKRSISTGSSSLGLFSDSRMTSTVQRMVDVRFALNAFARCTNSAFNEYIAWAKTGRVAGCNDLQAAEITLHSQTILKGWWRSGRLFVPSQASVTRGQRESSVKNGLTFPIRLRCAKLSRQAVYFTPFQAGLCL